MKIRWTGSLAIAKTSEEDFAGAANRGGAIQLPDQAGARLGCIVTNVFFY
jgi:hypothetical protein